MPRLDFKTVVASLSVLLAWALFKGAGAQEGDTITRVDCIHLRKYKVARDKNTKALKCVPPDCVDNHGEIETSSECDPKEHSWKRVVDPNDKSGPKGVDQPRFLSSRLPLPYAIFFENLESATASVQEVVITDQLDALNLDLGTLSLGPIVVGDQTVVPPPGLSAFTRDVDLRPAQNLVLRIDARVDQTTGVLTWRFTALDPVTLELTEDPSAGFLPPNVNPPHGEGSVLFTVMPRPAIATGIVTCNQAIIVFDVNAPIATPQRCNTFDTAKPASRVSALTPTQTSPDFQIQWAGTDEGSGISSYTISFSEDGGPFVPLLRGTTQTATIFTGQPGKTYAFRSVARDLVGNIEDVHSTADATTKVIPSDTDPPTTAASLAPLPNATGWNSGDVTVTLAAQDNEGGSGVEQITYVAQGAQTIPNTAAANPTSFVVAAEGQTTLTFFATDNAANAEAAHSTTIRLDKTSPLVSATSAPAPNANGWNVGPVTVSFTAEDALSGIATLTAPVLVTTEGANHGVVGTAVDRAGNSATATAIVNIDRTPPEAYLQFDLDARRLALFGRDDGSGTSPEPLQPTSVLRSRWNHGEDDEDDEGGAARQCNGFDTELRTYRVVDRAGNTLTLVVKMHAHDNQHGLHDTYAEIASLQYDSGSNVRLPSNRIQVRWAVDQSERLRRFTQTVVVNGHARDRQRVRAEFDAAQDVTTIVAGRGPARRVTTAPGRALLRLASRHGKAVIDY